ncbi:MAG: helix-turn-helix transcriptional regulator [Rhodobacterales bacterium]|nr:helix-turn-helix transcriptional regulator [Rhodobacterales bacterium]
MSDFAANLRFLAGHHPSVAQVCRRLGINRQQFNKYLAGASRPSAHNLRRLCDFFGVEEHEILLPAADFRGLVALKPRHGPVQGMPPYVPPVEALFDAASADVTRYLGTYHSYRYSFSEPDRILVSVIRLWRADGRVVTKRVERFAESDGAETRTFLCKYRGYLLFLRDRIYVVETDQLGRREVGETILYPGYRSQVTWLSGLHIGVSTKDDRRIGCGRVLWRHLGARVDLRRALAASGKVPPDAPDLPSLVVETLGRPGDGDPSSLFAVPR